jgi:hypothetical protein
MRFGLKQRGAPSWTQLQRHRLIRPLGSIFSLSDDDERTALSEFHVRDVWFACEIVQRFSQPEQALSRCIDAQ